MNELLEFLTSKEIIVVYIVAAIACFLCFIVYIIDKTYYKRKRKHNTKELNKLVEEVNHQLAEEGYDEEILETYDTPVLQVIEPEVKEEVVEIIEEDPIVEEIEDEPVVEIAQENVQVENIVLDTMTEEDDFIEIIDEEPELKYTNIEPAKEEAQAELQRLTEELQRAEEEVKNIDLTYYEEQQEENAIISLEELVKKSKEMYEQNEVTQYADEGNEPISLDDLEIKLKEYKVETPTTVESIVEEIESLDEPVIIETITEEVKEPVIEQQKLVLDDFNTVKVEPVEEVQKTVTNAYQTTKKFKSSPVISPIYGIRSQSELELENTANYEKLDEEIKKTNEFVMTLKELQSHLD